MKHVLIFSVWRVINLLDKFACQSECCAHQGKCEHPSFAVHQVHAFSQTQTLLTTQITCSTPTETKLRSLLFQWCRKTEPYNISLYQIYLSVGMNKYCANNTTIRYKKTEQTCYFQQSQCKICKGTDAVYLAFFAATHMFCNTIFASLLQNHSTGARVY